MVLLYVMGNATRDSGILLALCLFLILRQAAAMLGSICLLKAFLIAWEFEWHEGSSIYSFSQSTRGRQWYAGGRSVMRPYLLVLGTQ